MLKRCSLPLSLCRGQAYDGAANMQGKRNGVATKIHKDIPAAIAVHCFAHSLNLCLQDAGRKLVFLRNALDTVKEIAKLIKFSPKRSHLFSDKLAQPENSGITIKPFDMLFGLKLGYLVFGASESLSKSLQAKDTSLQEALAAVNSCKSFYRRQRTNEAFNHFYDDVVKCGEDLNIDSPRLPRYRRAPPRLDDGSLPHQFSTPKEYFRQQYFQTCDLLLQELENRFDQSLHPVLALESLLLKAANGQCFEEQLQTVRESCYSGDFNFDDLKRHLLLLVDIIKQGTPSVKEVTSIRTICDAMNSQPVFKSMLHEVHNLLR